MKILTRSQRKKKIKWDIKYLTKKLDDKLHSRGETITTIKDKKYIFWLIKLTRLTIGKKLPRICSNKDCTHTEDLHTHFKLYRYPIQRKDLIRLCRECHILEHQRLAFSIMKPPIEEELR